MDAREDELLNRRHEILARVDAALGRSGRSRGSIRLMAVSKTVDAPDLLAAIRVGYRLFGENRPQELVRKLASLAGREEAAGVRFDMIGNLQKNKINAVLGRVGCIQSVSSLSLAEAVSERAERRLADGSLTEAQPVLLEVNASGEASKSGFAPDELRRSLGSLRALCGVRITGLMTMAPRGDAPRARQTFSDLRDLRDELEGSYPDLSLSELSCGMSEDFEAALEEGSTLIRLGRVVFDPAFELK